MERERWNDAYCVKRWRKEGNLGEYGQMEDGVVCMLGSPSCPLSNFASAYLKPYDHTDQT